MWTREFMDASCCDSILFDSRCRKFSVECVCMSYSSMLLELCMFSVILGYSYGETGECVTGGDLESVVAGFYDELAHMQRYIGQLEASIIDHGDRNIALTRQVRHLQNDNDVMKTELSHVQKVARNHSRMYIEHQRTIQQLSDNLPSQNQYRTDQTWPRYLGRLFPHKTLTNQRSDARDEYFTRIKQTHVLPKGVTPSRSTMISSHNVAERLVVEANEEDVAFSVFVRDDITNLVKGDIIKFDGVLVNDGGGYDVTTGIFTAPRAGLYLFSFMVEDYHDQDLWVHLRQDNLIRAQAVAEPYEERQNVMGGNTVLLHVSTGSRVWISLSKGSRVQDNWTTFSGVFLY